jgi:hypothetical protein
MTLAVLMAVPVEVRTCDWPAFPLASGGGDEGNRTPNPRLAKAVLCQLSYVPLATRPRGRVAPGG